MVVFMMQHRLSAGLEQLLCRCLFGDALGTCAGQSMELAYTDCFQPDAHKIKKR